MLNQECGVKDGQRPLWNSFTGTPCVFWPFFLPLLKTLKQFCFQIVLKMNSVMRSSTCPAVSDEQPPGEPSQTCISQFLIKAPVHTPGWYLWSADSQLLVCFYTEKKKHPGPRALQVYSSLRFQFSSLETGRHSLKDQSCGNQLMGNRVKAWLSMCETKAHQRCPSSNRHCLNRQSFDCLTT